MVTIADKTVLVTGANGTGTALAKGPAEPGGVNVISAHLHR